MTDRKFAPHVHQRANGTAGLPGSLEEPYQAVQAQEIAPPEALWNALRVQRFFDQRLGLALLSAAALLLGGLFGLVLIWTFSFWIH